MMLQETRAERQRAMRALLQHPLLRAAGPFADEFGLIRRHREWLTDWLNRYPGWRLQIESEFARLRKTPGDITDSTRPAVEPKEEIPFTRRRYALYAWRWPPLNARTGRRRWAAWPKISRASSLPILSCKRRISVSIS